MKKLCLLLALLLPLAAHAQKAEAPLVLIGYDGRVIATRLVPGGSVQQTDDPAYVVRFMTDGRVLLYKDRMRIADGTLASFDPKDRNSARYAVGQKFTKPAPPVPSYPDTINFAELRKAATFFRMTVAFEPGTISRLRRLGYVLNERALVLECPKKPDLEVDLKGYALEDLNTAVRVKLKGTDEILIELENDVRLDALTLSPNEPPVCVERLKP